jgi:hypothetical protein
MTSGLELSHFSAALIFALCASVVFGICLRPLEVDSETGKDNPLPMIKYGAYCFAMFIGGVILAGWVMWLLKR